MSKFTLFKNSFILFQTCIFVYICLKSLQENSPFFYKNTDPAYEYLINGINLIYGMTPGHADHPGSTLQWALSLTHRIYYYTSGVNTNLKKDFVNEPEMYAITFSIISIIIHAFIIYLTTHKSYQIYKRKTHLLYPTIFTIVAYEYFDQLIGVKPENFLIMTAGLMIYGMLVFENKNQEKNTTKAVVYGLILAVGISTKLTFLPFLFLLFFIRSNFGKLLSVITMMAILLVLNIKLYGTFSLSWFTNIIFNGGRYGENRSKPFIDIISDLINIALLKYPGVAISIVLTVIIFFLPNFKGKLMKSETKLILYSSLLIIFGLFLVIKESLPRDFVIIIPLLAFVISVQLGVLLPINYFKNIWENNRLLAYTNLTLVLSLIFILSINTSNTYNILSNSDGFSENNDKYLFEKFHVSKSLEGDIVITDYDAPTQYAALQFGNALYGESSVRIEIDKKYPTSLHIVGSNIYNGENEKIGCQLFPRFLTEGRKIYVFSRSLKETESRINSSEHAFDWSFSDKFVDYKDLDLDWKIFEVINAKCRE
jgi:hypothetical protein